MLKCDRCEEHYKYTTTMVQGKRTVYLLCPICSYELRQQVDKFANTDNKNFLNRACGHIVAYIRHIDKGKKTS